MPVLASWVDSESGKTIKVQGTTENIGESKPRTRGWTVYTYAPVGSSSAIRLTLGRDGVVGGRLVLVVVELRQTDSKWPFFPQPLQVFPEAGQPARPPGCGQDFPQLRQT